MAKNAVAKKEEGALPAELMGEMADYAGAGTENFTREDFAIPFLRIIQKMSPQLSKRDPQYVAGAEEGMLINTVTGELWDGDEGVVVVPVAYQFKYIEWKPREQGGGFVASYTRGDDLPETTPNAKNQPITREGNLLTDTAEYYVLIVPEGGTPEPAVVTMSSTQLKKSRQWNSLIDKVRIQGPNGAVKPPMFACKYRLKTISESNDQGDWAGYKIESEGFVENRDLWNMAKEFYESVSSGKVQAKHQTLNADENEVM